MSTDYEIRCECGARAGADNWRQPAQVAMLLAARAEAVAVFRKMKGIWLYDIELPGLFEWFAEHEGHSMTVFDEYGTKWDGEKP